MKECVEKWEKIYGFFLKKKGETMAEYINKESALSVILGQPADAHYPSWYAAQIEKLKPVNVAPVGHGRWKKNRNEKTCSECHFIYYSNNDEWNYCPNCGAKMDGERRNDG